MTFWTGPNKTTLEPTWQQPSCCWISFAVVGILSSWSHTLRHHLHCSRSRKQHFDRWLHLQKQNRSPLVPPSPPTTQPLVSCFRLNRPQTGDRPLVLLLSSYGPVCFSWNAYELHYEQEQASFAMLPAPKSGPSSLGAFVTYHIWYQGIIDIYSEDILTI